jgi:hypothetical protein
MDRARGCSSKTWILSMPLTRRKAKTRTAAVAAARSRRLVAWLLLEGQQAIGPPSGVGAQQLEEEKIRPSNRHHGAARSTPGLDDFVMCQ